MTHTIRTLTSLGLLLALCLAFAAPVAAEDSRAFNTSVAPFASTTRVAAGATVLGTPFEVGRSSVQSLGRSFTTTGSVNVTVTFLCSDRQLSATTTTGWETASSSYGTSLTTAITFSDAGAKRTDLRLVPANWYLPVMVNNDVTPVIPDWFTIFRGNQ